MRQILRLCLIVFILIVSGCSKPEQKPSSVPFSQGPPQRWDIGSVLLKHPLPEDVADAYLELGKSPQSSYGITMAHKSLSARSHDEHDMILYGHLGTSRFHIGEKSFTIGVGDMLFIPRGAVYSAQTDGIQQLQYLTLYTPSFDGQDVTYHDKKDDKKSSVDQ